jgi:4-amino-4-deoxy-L-arabinose transferase-like glycosyltransferase
MTRLRRHPILILLAVNLLIGLMTFRSYGLAWDEPLFYDYADALPYAYSPRQWFSGDFNLERAFGASATDHANRGPAYLLLARPFVALVEALGSDQASAWHFTNFLAFQFGVYLFYRFAARWMSNPSALAAAALFAWQPLLWGHAFINPKDIPFLVCFLGSVCFGFEMVDEWRSQNAKQKTQKTILAAFFLGIATSIRVLGPLAAVLTLMYALIQENRIRDIFKSVWLYAALSLLLAFLTWPYLWLNPAQKFIEVFVFMSDNPTQLNVLFAGNHYQAGEVPRRYFPLLLGWTLTEPAWFLFFAGLAFGFWKSDNRRRITLALILLWFIVPFSYALLRRPAMYDGYRHFLFILPPIFLFAGFAFEKMFDLLKSHWFRWSATLLLLAFGIVPAIRLHPYQYAYYNAFAGGTGGVFREYETEYWLTCYREAVLRFGEEAPAGARLFVRREPYIAAYYANPSIQIHDFRTEQNGLRPGDFYLANTRSNEDLRFLRDQPAFIEVSRMGATFCVVKRMP